MTAYHVSWIVNSLTTRMSLEWGSENTFSPGQTSRSILKKTYPGYNKLFWLFPLLRSRCHPYFLIFLFVYLHFSFFYPLAHGTKPFSLLNDLAIFVDQLTVSILILANRPKQHICLLFHWFCLSVHTFYYYCKAHFRRLMDTPWTICFECI